MHGALQQNLGSGIYEPKTQAERLLKKSVCVPVDF